MAVKYKEHQYWWAKHRGRDKDQQPFIVQIVKTHSVLPAFRAVRCGGEWGLEVRQVRLIKRIPQRRA